MNDMQTQDSRYLSKKVLVIDDDEDIRDLLVYKLEDSGFETDQAEDGEDAFEKLKSENYHIDVILVDKKMPKLDGFSFLEKIKKEESLKDIPVVMITGAVMDGDMARGTAAGAFYFLTKPVDMESMIAVIRAAINEKKNYEDLRSSIKSIRRAVTLVDSVEFSLQTVSEARTVTKFLCNICPDPEVAVVGLIELLTNAVEHGNLGISYDEKTKYALSDTLQEEISTRLVLPENKDKRVKLTCCKTKKEISFRIQDEGAGFDWEPYMEFDARRLTDSHGRGIAMAKLMTFTDIEYLGCGNELIATIALDGNESL